MMSVPREGQFDQLQAIFHSWCMVMVRKWIKVNVNRVRVRLRQRVGIRVSVSADRVRVSMGTEKAPLVYICPS